jgi:hypothetical protein
MNYISALGGTFAFVPSHKFEQKMQNSQQTNAPRHTKWTKNNTTEKKYEG